MTRPMKFEWRKSGFQRRYVQMLDDETLEWCGWDDHPGGGGACIQQTVSEFVETGIPRKSWLDPPEDILIKLREAVETSGRS